MNEYEDEFWTSLDQLISLNQVIIDRPKGSQHPRFADMIYPVDYGYLEGTCAADGDGIDVWVGTAGACKVQGLLCTFDMEKQDAEIKLLCGCSPDELDMIERFMNQHSMQILVIIR